jgi:hypothetical protein
MDVQSERVTTDFGESVTLYRSTAGNVLCPVCGREWPETAEWDGPFYLNSLDVCDECETQWGWNDLKEIPPVPQNPPEKRWHKLRLKWLDRVGWSEPALRQLRANLGMDIDALMREAGRGKE